MRRLAWVLVVVGGAMLGCIETPAVPLDLAQDIAASDLSASQISDLSTRRCGDGRCRWTETCVQPCCFGAECKRAAEFCAPTPPACIDSEASCLCFALRGDPCPRPTGCNGYGNGMLTCSCL